MRGKDEKWERKEGRQEGGSWTATKGMLKAMKTLTRKNGDRENE